MLTSRHIGLVSTRFAGTDGVSLESRKWTEVLKQLGHHCFYFSGESDYPAELSWTTPEAHFLHPAIWEIYTNAFSHAVRPPAMTRRIRELQAHLKAELDAFVRAFGIEVLLVQNALAIPLNIPLGLALTEYIAETGFPVLAHHHDFFWERPRFLVNCVWDYLHMAFPPHLPTIRHVVINSLAANQLSLRTGISSLLIPNVMDFEHPPAPPDEYTDTLRADLAVAPGQALVLQPTRVVARKGIEHAMELVRRLGSDARLVISHSATDEGNGYVQHLRAFAGLLGIDVNFESAVIGAARGRTAEGRKIYSLADVYQCADLVTYPSTIEGFGNAFLEAIYYRRPLVVNDYSIFATDIKPKGFRVISFEGFITEDTLAQTRHILRDRAAAGGMVELNYQLATKHYSYAVLRRSLETILVQLFGE